ncbi:MAG: metallophosphoesterase family protein [Anaerolineae bacterium]|nr:metallophosphoesterase family protein [Anaerolineae bacterium]
MDIGVISDIHGDYAALQIALERLDNFHRADIIVCAGDLVGRGPQPDSVVELIRKRNIPTVRGNHDDWNYTLDPENKDYLKSLPLEWRGSYENHTIFMCHGKPGNNLWGLYRDHISATLLNMMLSSLNATVLVTGHTHVPLFMKVDRGCVINPGSIYTFHNVRATSHTYGVLRLSEMSFELYDLTESVGERVFIA